MAARPSTLAQRIENERFLRALTDTGNARLAARSLGLNRSTLTKRRARDAAFAQNWEAALAAAHARFHLGGGARVAEAAGPRAKGGEPFIVRRANGRLQLRLALPGQVTRVAEQGFLRALSATANIRLSAAAAGISHSTAYKRKDESKAFAGEMRAALDIGYDRLELAVIEGFGVSNEWLRNELPPIPAMSAAEALQLLALHRNAVKLGWDEPHRRKRRNESQAQYGQRLFLMWRAEQRNLHHDRVRARGEAFERDGKWRLPGDWPEAPALPPLEQVTGWSKARKNSARYSADAADPAGVGSPTTDNAGSTPASGDEPAKGKGLFGGWTIADLGKRRSGGLEHDNFSSNLHVFARSHCVSPGAPSRDLSALLSKVERP